jgi:hypothetical protein
MYLCYWATTAETSNVQQLPVFLQGRKWLTSQTLSLTTTCPPLLLVIVYTSSQQEPASSTRSQPHQHAATSHPSYAHGSLAEFPALLSRVAAGPVPTCHGVAGALRLLGYAVNLSRRHLANLSTVIVYTIILPTCLLSSSTHLPCE